MSEPSSGSANPQSQPADAVDLASQSVAGEEDPGASLDMPDSSPAAAPLNPADQAPAGTLGTGENICRDCGGLGQLSGARCQTCGGTGRVIEGLGGG